MQKLVKQIEMDCMNTLRREINNDLKSNETRYGGGINLRLLRCKGKRKSDKGLKGKGCRKELG